jgi:hypothetical protein
MLLALPRAVPAQTVESAYSIVLTVKRTTSGAAGDRMQFFRMGTKEVIDRFLTALELDRGRSVRLVVQRPIEDLGFQHACEFLVIDGQYHPVGGSSERIEMPDSFAGFASSSVRRPGQSDLFFTQEAVGMFRMRDAIPESGELTLSAVASRSARLHVLRGITYGYLHARILWSVNGGMFRDQELMPISGTLLLGPEKLVEQPAGGCAP